MGKPIQQRSQHIRTRCHASESLPYRMFWVSVIHYLLYNLRTKDRLSDVLAVILMLDGSHPSNQADNDPEEDGIR